MGNSSLRDFGLILISLAARGSCFRQAQAHRRDKSFVVSAAASVGSGRSRHIDFVKYPATLALFQKVAGVRGERAEVFVHLFQKVAGVRGQRPCGLSLTAKASSPRAAKEGGAHRERGEAVRQTAPKRLNVAPGAPPKMPAARIR